jgi:pentatricopeptide repeat protein
MTMRTTTITATLRRANRRPTLFLLLAALLFLAASVLGLLLPAAPPAAVSPLRSTESEVARWERAVEDNPRNARAHAALGLALLQQVRESGDFSLYQAALEALDAALRLQPGQLEGLLGQGQLALARHDFSAAPAWAQEARAVAPHSAAALGILVDAYVELGRYEEAVDMLQQMVDLRPGVAAYSRIAYMRQLHGDLDGAVEAMTLAVEGGAPGHEQTLWSLAQLAELYINQGDLARAEAAFRRALAFKPDYAPAREGLAHVQAARGDVAGAIAALSALGMTASNAHYAAALGDLYALAGDEARAAQQYAHAEAIMLQEAALGVDVGLELAALYAGLGTNNADALSLARAAYRERPTIYAADALSWALYQVGEHDAAWRYSLEARRLGTQDGMLLYHAALIAQARGERTTARQLLRQLLATDPYYSFADIQHARELLGDLIQN